MHCLESYLKELADIRSTGAGLPETSYYPALSNLLNAIGHTLKPKVRCIIHLQNRGAGIPDGGLFTPDQFQRGREVAGAGCLRPIKGGGDAPLEGQLPARGAIEVKPCSDDAFITADGKQVSKYWGR